MDDERDDTPEREAEKREATERDTEQGDSADRAGAETPAEEGVLGGTPGHIPARSD